MARNQDNKIKTTVLENRGRIVIGLIILVDIFTVSLAVLLSTLIRVALLPIMGGVVNWPLILRGLVLYLIFTVILAWLNGLYPGFGLAAVHEMQKVLYVVSLASIFLGVFLFLQQLGLAYSRLIFLLTWLLSALFMMLGRFGLRNRLSQSKWWGIPMVVVGSPETAEPIIEQLIQNRRLGFRPVYYFDPDNLRTEPILGVPVIKSKILLTDFIKSANIEYVVFTDAVDDVLSKKLQWMRDVFPNIIFIVDTASFGSLWVKTMDLHGTLAIETNYHLLNKRERVIKQILDMLLTILIYIISLPIFLVLAVVVRLDSRGPILFTQKRLGQNGKPFDSFKFRTMYNNAEAKLHDLLANNPEAKREYEKFHKLANDPRVTPVGKILRRYSLDELPQLINVIKGDMNLIGPRSYLPRELPAMGEYAKIILKVKPGITGWWQVMGRNATSFKERLRLDEYYISNWSIWLDIYIVIKTVWVLITGQGL